MSIKEIREAMKNGNVYLGIRQTLKNSKGVGTVFIPRDARSETTKKLELAGLEFTPLRSKSNMAKELGINFECEVFSIRKSPKKESSKKKK